jgi:hypothetical protein
MLLLFRFWGVSLFRQKHTPLSPTLVLKPNENAVKVVHYHRSYAPRDPCSKRPRSKQKVQTCLSLLPNAICRPMRMHTLTLLSDEEGLLKAIQPVDIQNQEPRTSRWGYLSCGGESRNARDRRIADEWFVLLMGSCVEAGVDAIASEGCSSQLKRVRSWARRRGADDSTAGDKLAGDDD